MDQSKRQNFTEFKNHTGFRVEIFKTGGHERSGGKKGKILIQIWKDIPYSYVRKVNILNQFLFFLKK